MRKLHLFAVLPVCMSSGCLKQDGDKMLRVARVAADQVRNVAPNKSPLDEFGSDGRPEAKIRLRLKTDVYLVDYKIDVDVVDGTFILRGRVPNAECKIRAGELAVSTIGVGPVKNEIEVVPKS
jgi:osmotically-inducible protein OsmY